MRHAASPSEARPVAAPAAATGRGPGPRAGRGSASRHRDNRACDHFKRATVTFSARAGLRATPPRAAIPGHVGPGPQVIQSVGRHMRRESPRGTIPGLIRKTLALPRKLRSLARRARHHPPGSSGLVADSLPSGDPFHTRARPPAPHGLRAPAAAARQETPAPATVLALRDGNGTNCEKSQPRQGRTVIAEGPFPITRGPRDAAAGPRQALIIPGPSTHPAARDVPTRRSIARNCAINRFDPAMPHTGRYGRRADGPDIRR